MNPDPSVMGNPFAEYGRTVRRRKWWLIGTAVVVTVAALGYSLTETKQFTATGSLQVLPQLVQSTTGNGGGAAASPQTLTQEAQTDAALIVTQKVKQAVVAFLVAHKTLPPGSSPPQVSATVSSTSNLLEVSSSGATPQLAQTFALTYAQQFIVLQKAQALTNYNAATAAVKEEINNDLSEEGPLNAQLAHIAKNPKTGASEPTQAQIQAEISLTAVRRDVQSLEQAIGTIAADSNLATGGVELAAPPVLPKTPSSPKTDRNVGLGIVVGLILGLILAFVIDGFDDSIRSEEEVDRSYPNLPHLGVIPMVEGWNDANRPYIVTLEAPLAVASEAYRSLRTAVEFARLNRSVRTILVTSSMGLEGKTSTAANLGVVFAGSGQHTLIVSADLRRPRLGTFFGLSEDVGLSSLALGIATPEEAIQIVESVPGLSFLGTGPLPAGAAEFLSSPKLEEVIGDLRDRFDIVIIDAPPVLPVTDAVVMSRYLDGVLLVVAQNRTHRRSLQRVHALLTQVNAQVLGSMINGAAIRGADAYGYYGKYAQYGAYGAQDSSNGEGKGGGSGSSRRRKRSQAITGGAGPDAERTRRTGT